MPRCIFKLLKWFAKWNSTYSNVLFVSHVRHLGVRQTNGRKLQISLIGPLCYYGNPTLHIVDKHAKCVLNNVFLKSLTKPARHNICHDKKMSRFASCTNWFLSKGKRPGCLVKRTSSKLKQHEFPLFYFEEKY